MKLKELESVLISIDAQYETTVYDSIFKALNERREKEYCEKVPKGLRGSPKVSRREFLYSTELQTKGYYSIFNGEIDVRTLDLIQLPVNESTITRGVKITTEAPVPCDCWIPVREHIAQGHKGWVEEKYQDPYYSEGKRLTRSGRDESVVCITITELENVKLGIEKVQRMKGELSKKIELETERLKNL